MDWFSIKQVGPEFHYAAEMLGRWVVIEVIPIANGRVERILDFNDRDDRDAAVERALSMNKESE